MSEVVSQAIRAVVRVRPFTPKETTSKPLPVLRVTRNEISIDKSTIHQAEQGTDPMMASVSSPSSPIPGFDRRSDPDSTFAFDSVLWSVEPHPDLPAALWPSVTGQEEVFKEVGQPAVEAMLRGYNVSVFAYGQTGSGKSHTIFGPRTDPGLAPRISDLLFERVSEISERGTGRTEVEVSCFEIYNEKITDLLAVRSNTHHHHNHHNRPLAGKHQKHNGRRQTVLGGSASSGSVQRRSSVNLHRINSTTSGGTGDGRSSPSHVDLCGDSLGELLQDEFPSTFVEEEFPSGSGVDVPLLSPNQDRLSPVYLPDVALLQQHQQLHSPRNGSVVAGHPSTLAKELKVRHSPQLGVYVEGLRKEQVTDAISLNVAIHQALNHRVTASTNMNSGSSRSHAIIQISVEHLDEVQGRKMSATLSLVDLAGSERVERSGAQGQQFTEAKNINQSLSVLRRVIDTITDNHSKRAKQVVPFRESALTWILMDCFGGTSSTTMIAAISPHLSNLTDTVSTLRYASKCKRIVNTVKSNEVRVAIVMGAVQKEMERVKREMLELQSRNEAAFGDLEAVKMQTAKKRNAAQLFKKRADVKAKLVEELRQRLESASLEAAPTLERYEDLLSMKAEGERASEEAQLHRTHMLEAQRRASEEQMRLKELNKQLAEARYDIKELVGLSIDNDATKAARKRRFRRQFLIVANEQRGINELAALALEVEVLKESERKLQRDLDELTTDVEVEQAEVEEVSQYERAAKRAASELGSVHQEMLTAAAAYRRRTGEVTRHVELIAARMADIDREMEALREEHREQMFFGASVVEGLRDEVGEATAKRDALSSEVFELEALHTENFERVDFLVRELSSHDERLESSFHESARLESLMRNTTALVAAEEEALTEELQELERIESIRAGMEKRIIEAHLVLNDHSQSLKAAQRTTRQKVFPDAPKQYFDPVLSRMALDLESASSTSNYFSRRQLKGAKSPSTGCPQK